MSCLLQAGEIRSKDTGAVQFNKPSKRPGDVLHHHSSTMQISCGEAPILSLKSKKKIHSERNQTNTVCKQLAGFSLLQQLQHVLSQKLV